MLRADSVTYSSVPLDEGTTPGSSFTTSRSPHNPHSQRDCQLTAIITTIVIVTGLTLAVTLPLILKGSSSTEKGRIEGDNLSVGQNGEDLWSSHLNGGNDKSVTVKEPDYFYEGFEDYDTDKEESGASRTTKPSIPVVTTKKPTTTPEPVALTVKLTTQGGAKESVAANISASSSVNEGDNNGDTKEENLAPTEGNVASGNEGSALAVTEGKYPQQESGAAEAGVDSNSEIDLGQRKTTTQAPEPDNSNVKEEGLLNLNGTGSDLNSQTQTTEGKVGDIDLEQLLNEIYGEEGNSKPSSVDTNSWTSDVISAKDKVTLVILAAVVAVALAAVVTAVVWLIHARVTARRRRINIQNVITDLQSRDKIVLLNSEESEEE